MINVVINKTFNYGGHRIWFKKEFELPYPPFDGLMIVDKDVIGNELTFQLLNNEYKGYLISYDNFEKTTYIDHRDNINDYHNIDYIEEDLDLYTTLGWTLMINDFHIIKNIIENKIQQV